MADPDLASIVQTLPGSSADLAAAQAALAASLIARFQPGLPPADRSPADWSGEAVDDRSWPGLDVPRVWEEQGLPGFDGVVWYRRRVTLTAEQAAGQATLHLGTIDDCDDSFVNGRRVGGDCVWNAARHHPVPAGLLHEGDNLIAVRVTDTGGPGGFYGDAAAVRLETQAGDLRLSGRWRARIEAPQLRDRLDADDAPTLLFNAMVQPLLPLRIRGVLWYQGESNVPRAARYAGAFQRLIRDWRAQWGEGDFPFYFVQLASYLPLEKNSAIGSEWAELRDAQRQALKLPNTGMVVATDIGDASDIHPRNKRAVGDRLADIALHDLHGRRAIVSRGPDYRAMRRVDAAIELRFANPGRGLAVRGGDRVALQGFAIADASRRFRPARATLHGDRVIVASDEVSNPVAVRYGWVDNPEQANLINREGLPASPFRTDDWPLLTEGGRFRP
jgi:sialate O-acetylesterase